MNIFVTIVTVLMILCQGAFAVAVFVVLRPGRSKPSEPIKRLMAVGGFTDQTDLLNDAMNFYEAMTEQAMKGNLVGYMDREKQFTQVLTKGMRWAKDVGRVTGAGEAT